MIQGKIIVYIVVVLEESIYFIAAYSSGAVSIDFKLTLDCPLVSAKFLEDKVSKTEKEFLVLKTISYLSKYP